MKEKLEKILNLMVDTGSSYSDIFIEEKTEKSINLLDGKIDKIKSDFLKGIGLRICDGHNTFYSALNNVKIEDLESYVLDLRSNLKKKRKLDNIFLNDLIDNSKRCEKVMLTDLEKKNILLNIDTIARNYSDKICQVSARIEEDEQVVLVATSDSKFVKDKRFLKRLVVIVMAKDNDKRTQSVFTSGSSFDYDFLHKINLEEEIKNLAQITINKLNADYAPSGMMPVVIGNDSGVLIHEACGHALEATSVADDASVLSDFYGKKIAPDFVTIIDDGSIQNLFGTTDYDDEGERTQKNILVKDGILNSFLVDKKNSRRMNHEITSSGRRQSYCYAPTSRMNNTYLANGNSTVSEIIESVKFGLYAKSMGGGQVNPVTGDFNFGVNEAYLIKDGKIAEMVVGASLIGNIKDVLNNIEMVGNDLNFDTGTCGSESGWCPVTCGQPTIKLSNILVGGKK